MWSACKDAFVLGHDVERLQGRIAGRKFTEIELKDILREQTLDRDVQGRVLVRKRGMDHSGHRDAGCLDIGHIHVVERRELQRIERGLGQVPIGSVSGKSGTKLVVIVDDDVDVQGLSNRERPVELLLGHLDGHRTGTGLVACRLGIDGNLAGGVIEGEKGRFLEVLGLDGDEGAGFVPVLSDIDSDFLEDGCVGGEILRPLTTHCQRKKSC